MTPTLLMSRMVHGRRTTLLHDACEWSSPLPVLERLIEKNPRAIAVPVHSHNGLFPLHWACNASSLENVQLLLSEFPEAATYTDADGAIPLHFALLCNASEDIIMSLIASFPEGARVQDLNGETPLHYALFWNDSRPPRIIKKLLDVSPDSAGIFDVNGNAPLHYACKHPLEVVKMVVNHYPAAVQARGCGGQLPLHNAVHYGYKNAESVVQFLIDLFPDSVQAIDAKGMLPLHHVCESAYRTGASEIAELLIGHYNDSGANHSGASVTDYCGRLPLHCACRHGHLDIMHVVLGFYPEGVRVADSKGMLPLHHACRGSSEITRHLIEEDIFTTLHACNKGKTTLQVAFTGHWQPMLSLNDRQYMLEKQDEALSLLHGAFEPTVVRFALPDLVLSEIWGFALPRIWRPTEEEMRLGRVNSD